MASSEPTFEQVVRMMRERAPNPEETIPMLKQVQQCEDIIDRTDLRTYDDEPLVLAKGLSEEFDFPFYKAKDYLISGFAARHLATDFHTLKTTPDQVIVASWPKNGTTWLLTIVVRLMEKSGRIPELADCPIFNTMYYWTDSVMPFPPPEYCPLFKVIKSHLPAELNHRGWRDQKIIHIWRDPRDQAVSQFKFFWGVHHIPESYDKGMDAWVLASFQPGGFNSTFAKFVASYYKAHNVLNFKFADLKNDLKGCIQKIDAFLGLNLDDQAISDVTTETTFANMKASDRLNPDKVMKSFVRDTGNFTFMRKGETGNHRNELSREVSDEVWRLAKIQFEEEGIAHLLEGSE